MHYTMLHYAANGSFGFLSKEARKQGSKETRKQGSNEAMKQGSNEAMKQ